MKYYLFFLLAVMFLIISCEPGRTVVLKKKGIILDARYAKINNLISIANCRGKDLSYTTEVHSSKDGYTSFTQTFEPDNQKIEVIIHGDTLGYILDESGEKSADVSKANIMMIKGHEFHQMHTQPDLFYDSLTYLKNEIYHL